MLKGQSFAFGDRTLTRANLDEIVKGRREWERKASVEACGLSASQLGVRVADFSGGCGYTRFREAE